MQFTCKTATSNVHTVRNILYRAQLLRMVHAILTLFVHGWCVMFSYKKVGGLHFVTIGRLQLSFCIKRAKTRTIMRTAQYVQQRTLVAELVHVPYIGTW